MFILKLDFNNNLVKKLSNIYQTIETMYVFIDVFQHKYIFNQVIISLKMYNGEKECHHY